SDEEILDRRDENQKVVGLITEEVFRSSGVVTDYLTAAVPLGAAEPFAASFTCATCGSDVDTSCNGLDDDCDGQTDEDYVVTSSNCGMGVCAASGLVTCQGGVLVDTCAPGSPASWTNTFDTLDDADDVYVSVYRGTQFCDAITGTGPGLTCAPEPGFSATGGFSGGYVYGSAQDNLLRHYGLTVDAVQLPNLLGGQLSARFRTFNRDQSGPGSVKAAEGSSNLAANATTATARARWIITARNPSTNAIWIWVSRDDFAWNPNDDTTWTSRSIPVSWANFAQWQPFMTNTYGGGSPAEFADSVNNVIRVGVIMSDASIVYASHLHASWFRTAKYGVMSASLPTGIELGWDELTLSSTGSDCNSNGLDDDCNGTIDDCTAAF
ncbi:MAG TPA: hypothetical protein PLV68_20335, partial [Ilumatobacteraceae bacterium]|nr:hypothetical protein [Ilumatobacteraceae bacterium]